MATPSNITPISVHATGSPSRRAALASLSLGSVLSFPCPATASPAARSSDAELIAEAARVEEIARRENQAWARLQRAEERYRAICPTRPTLPDSEMADHEAPKLLRAAVAALATSTSHHAVHQLEHMQGRLERLEIYEGERDTIFRRLHVREAILVAERWNERLVTAANDLTFMPATTREGLAAKSRAWLTLRRLAPRDQSLEWAADLAEMTIRETVMLLVRTRRR